MADQLLGYRNAVFLGGRLMAIGEFLILGNHIVPSISADSWLYIGMGTIIVGNGYFKANISSIVGTLYEDSDPRKDAGFTIFLHRYKHWSPFGHNGFAQKVGNIYGAEYGFALAGFGMILGMFSFQFLGRFIGGQEEIDRNAAPKDPEKLNAPWIGPITRFHAAIVGSILAIPLLYTMLVNYESVGYLLGAVALYVVGNLLYTAFKSDNVQRDKIFVLIILMFFNIIFWACFEQAGTSSNAVCGKKRGSRCFRDV